MVCKYFWSSDALSGVFQGKIFKFCWHPIYWYIFIGHAFNDDKKVLVVISAFISFFKYIKFFQIYQVYIDVHILSHNEYFKFM